MEADFAIAGSVIILVLTSTNDKVDTSGQAHTVTTFKVTPKTMILK